MRCRVTLGDSLRSVTMNFVTLQLKHVCYDVQTEPLLEPLTGKTFELRSTITAHEARLDVSARGLWEGHQKAFVDVRVVNPLAMRYQDQDPTRILESNAKEKKRQYCRRVLEIENGTFTPLIFTTNGGMGASVKRSITALLYS